MTLSQELVTLACIIPHWVRITTNSIVVPDCTSICLMVVIQQTITPPITTVSMVHITHQLWLTTILRTFTMEAEHITHTMMRRMGTTIIPITALVMLDTADTTSDLIMGGITITTVMDIMPTIIGAGTMAHSMQADRTITLRQGNILAHRTLQPCIPAGVAVLGETQEQQVTLEQRVTQGQVVLLALAAWQRQHNPKAERASAVGQVAAVE